MTRATGHRVLVAGGGVVGLASAAALLARDPELSVTVLDRGLAGEGASRYAGALDIPFFRNGVQRSLVEASWAWHAARGAPSAEYRRPVQMTWFAEPDFDLRSHLAEPAEEGGAAPGWRPPEGTRSFRGRSFVIDPRAFCRQLAREVVRSGRGEVVERAEVVAIDPQGAAVRCADGRSLAGAHVVLALGPWLPGWDERTRAWARGISLRTKRVFGLDVTIDPGAPPAAAAWPGADVHLHPAPDGRGYRLSLRHDEWDVDPDGEHRMADEALERARRFLDPLVGPGRWSVTGHRVFADSYTADFQAVAGPCGALGERVTVATGTHGSGIRMAPGIAERVARAVLDRLRATGGAP